MELLLPTILISLGIIIITGIHAEEAGDSSSPCPLEPLINLISPTASDDAVEIINDGVMVNRKVNLTIDCRSSKPVDLDFEGVLALELHQVQSFRTVHQNDAENEYENACYSIQIKLIGDREATGIYRCWHIGEKATTNKTLNIYANGSNNSPHLLLSDLGEEISVVAKNAEEGVLPCAVNNPEIPVALYRVKRENFELITQGEHLTFHPAVGFTLKLQKFPDPFEKFKCVAGGDKRSIHDEVVVNLLPAEEKQIPKLPDTEVFENAFAKGRDRQSFLCTGPLGLGARSTPNCRTTMECRLVEKCMMGLTFCPHSCKCSTQGQRCSTSVKKQYFNLPNKHWTGDRCESLGKNENGGIIHCSHSQYLYGSILTYFIGLGGKVVSDWRKAPLDEILSMAAPYGTSTVYNVGEKVPFTCVASRFVFAQGFKWKLLLENGTFAKANVTWVGTRITDSLIKSDVEIHISMPEIKEIVCEAPVWNETSWVSSSLSLKIQDTVAPIFLDPSNITIYFHSNDKNKSLICEAKGFPHPDILWYKNGEEIRTDLIYDTTQENITAAVLTFPEIGESEHGTVYSCNASNPRGMVFKTYTIHIRASMWTLVFSIAGVALFICFVGVFIMSVRLFQGSRKPRGYTIRFTDLDVKEFKQGNPEAVKQHSDPKEKAFYLPYDEGKFEITEDQLEMDTGNVLGEGEFGIVFKGNLSRKKDESPYSVAVKTLKNADAQHLRMLLQELKVMIYIGSHQNVVQLIGAVTSHLSEGKVYVVVEHCALGNLQDYVRKQKGSFLDEFTPGQAKPSTAVRSSYVVFNYAMKTSDLLRWAYEIAIAMEYLALKKIIHGDLALRNVLLDADQTAKITDFGLSKRLYKHPNYYTSTSKDVPVPWKWMAPESLRERSYSIHSDVWSYGVLLWELFSLGEDPYIGCTFGQAFMDWLSTHHGRLGKPKWCNGDIYINIIRHCWQEQPSERPAFSKLREALEHRLPHPSSSESDSEEEVTTKTILSQGTVGVFMEERLPLRV